MKYINIPASANEFFVLFHGTGGNEYSLLTVPGDIMKLAKQLTDQFPATALKMLDTGHEVTPVEVQAAAEYLKKE